MPERWVASAPSPMTISLASPMSPVKWVIEISFLPTKELFSKIYRFVVYLLRDDDYNQNHNPYPKGLLWDIAFTCICAQETSSFKCCVVFAGRVLESRCQFRSLLERTIVHGVLSLGLSWELDWTEQMDQTSRVFLSQFFPLSSLWYFSSALYLFTNPL